MPFSSALGTCSAHWSIEEQILCRRAHHFFFPCLRFWHHSSFVKCYQSADILIFLLGASPALKYYCICMCCVDTIWGWQDQILCSQEPPYHFEPLLTASTIFSGRIFLSSLLLDCKLLEYRNYFCFPHLCIHCSASLYLVHNSCSAIVNEQIIYTDLNIWLPSDIEYESTPDPRVVSLPWAG